MQKAILQLKTAQFCFGLKLRAKDKYTVVQQGRYGTDNVLLMIKT